jgi:hypothetical protein
MLAARSRTLWDWLRANRNLLLFFAMLVIVALLPAFEDSNAGEMRFAAVNTFIIVVAVAANGRSRGLFWLALLLAAPALALRAIAFYGTTPSYLVWSWTFSAGVMLVTIVRLLGDVFRPGTVTRDNLFACATIYLVLGVLWCYLYAIAAEECPGSFSGLSTARSLHVVDLAYFSFNVVTNIALTDAVPVGRVAQMLVILQELASVLYMAFVISRLVGMYAPEPREARGSSSSHARETRD